jgi:hypothetical protein
LLLNLQLATTTILVVFNTTILMRFAIVTSSISALLITVVSAISIVVLSWLYPAVHSYDPASELNAEIAWGQGS